MTPSALMVNREVDVHIDDPDDVAQIISVKLSRAGTATGTFTPLTATTPYPPNPTASLPMGTPPTTSDQGRLLKVTVTYYDNQSGPLLLLDMPILHLAIHRYCLPSAPLKRTPPYYPLVATRLPLVGPTQVRRNGC